MLRYKINWTGFIGGPGYTNLHFEDASEDFFTQADVDAFALKIDTWLDAWAGSIASTVTYLLDPTVEVIDQTTGDLLSFWTATTDTARVGASTGSYAAPAGACLNWYTAGIRNGRRVRGRTFMVPLGGTALQSDGTIDNTKLTALRTATATMIAPLNDDAGLGVWSRPSGPEATDGIWHRCTSYTLPDKVAILTSRRD